MTPPAMAPPFVEDWLVLLTEVAAGSDVSAVLDADEKGTVVVWNTVVPRVVLEVVAVVMLEVVDVDEVVDVVDLDVVDDVELVEVVLGAVVGTVVIAVVGGTVEKSVETALLVTIVLTTTVPGMVDALHKHKSRQ